MALTEKEISLDSIKGMLWGVAIGDCLGAPHEFKCGPSLSKYNGRVQFKYFRQSRWQGRRTGVLGQVTDDTEMTLALSRTLIDYGDYNKNMVIRAYLAWANSKPAIGNTTRELFQNIKTVRGYESRYKKMYATDDKSNWSQSNGCLMRASPLAVLPNYLEATKMDCELSNPHPICTESCTVYVNMLRLILTKTEPESVINQTEKITTHKLIKDLFGEKSRDITIHKGWVINGLWCAIQALRLVKTKTFSEIIDWVIKLGGDTDTNAAIAGALVGAYKGYEIMNSEKNTAFNIEIIRGADTSKGGLVRPDNYTGSWIDSTAKQMYETFAKK